MAAQKGSRGGKVGPKGVQGKPRGTQKGSMGEPRRTQKGARGNPGRARWREGRRQLDIKPLYFLAMEIMERNLQPLPEEGNAKSHTQ